MPIPPEQLSDDDFDRLARYVSGEAAGPERAELSEWIAGDRARIEGLREVEEAWASSSEAPDVNVDLAWSALASRVAAPIEITRAPSVVTQKVRVWPSWRYSGVLKIAAAAVLIAWGGSLLLARNDSATIGDRATASTGGRVETKAGERRTIPLPDGSLVILGPASTIVVADAFSAKSDVREVTLQGEGYFRVVHDQKHPFRVRVANTLIEDLGTEFAVRAYPGDQQLRVAVASGSVALRRSSTTDTAAVLSPRDVAIVRDTGSISLSRNVDVARFTAFTSGRLVFADSPLEEVARDLTRWYGVDVRVSDEALLARHLTATFEAETLDEVLRVIGMSLNVRYERNDRGISFMGPGTGGAGGAGGTAGTATPKGVAPSPPAPSRHEAGV